LADTFLATLSVTTLARPAESHSAVWIPDESQILFVGDIQGCAEDLARLLEHAGFNPGIHRLVPLGDTVNRGPDAPGVLRLLRELGATPIIGNHERALLTLDGIDDTPAWAQGPGSAYHQLDKRGLWFDAVAWMRQWPYIARGPGWIAVHAGLHPRLQPEATDPDFLTTVRWCTAQGTLPDKGVGNGIDAPHGFSPWHMFYQGQDRVFFGHWARQGLLLRERLRGLDTGCVYGRQLTGVWWPEDRLVQVDALKR
jgi:bis(5'-nucleosyl)-tetraphosphatase (symmetrical)